MNYKNDYDIRQLKLMNENLMAFDKGEISLYTLQSRLEFLLQVMEHVDDSWEFSFLEEIGTLASINAEEPVDKSINLNKIKNEAIHNLKNLVEGALQSLEEK